MDNMSNPSPEQMKKMFEEMQRKENEGLSPEEIEKKNKEREEKKQKNISTLQETLEICQNLNYQKEDKTINLDITPNQMSRVQVFMPEEIEIQKESALKSKDYQDDCLFSCENKDALLLAYEKTQDSSYQDDHHILLLNLASAVKPGGGVRDGMGGQEEDLCRNSTLLLSLESEEAKCYYDYNQKLNTRLGSDAMIISPEVSVFRNSNGELLEQPFTISVLTCSAPNIRFGLEGKSEDEYKKLLYNRIENILYCARSLGYKNLILGAFGCGAFKNDAALVSDYFYQALTSSAGKGLKHVDFAVLCSPGKEYNYNEFCRNFACEKK